LAALFPWAGPMETAAHQFNQKMVRRYDNLVDFIKVHYCLSQRRDSDFWIDNCDSRSIPDSLQERLENWRYRTPDVIDIDYGHDTFIEGNWRQVLYGMGFRTDLSARHGAYRYHEAARKAFSDINRQADYAISILPSHRDLIEDTIRRSSAPAKRNAIIAENN
jgi:tryptophan 7-halogenase